MLDCTDVNKLIKNRAGERRYFARLVLLIQWQLDCLKQIEDGKRERFPREQEEILFNSIKAQVKTVKIRLIQLDMRDLKFIGVILRDYKVGENVNFNKFLVESLFSSYKSISEEMLDKVELERMKKPSKQNIPKEFIEFLKLDLEIELDQYLDFSNKAKIDSYLGIRRDADSLYSIYSTIGSLEQTLKGNQISIEEKRLALQRLFHITGEYLKDTQVSPNLSPDVKQSLEEKGIPTKTLSKYRDTLAHYQVFPLIEGNNNQVKELFDECFLPIQEVIKSEIIETENSFVQKIIENKGNEFKIDKSVVERLLESNRRKGVQGLEECIRTMRSEDKYRSMDDETKKIVDEVYETVRRMKSMDFPVDPVKPSGGELTEKKPISNSIIEYISKSKLEAYDKLRDAVAPIFERHAGGLKNTHADVIKITQVIDYLSYKDTFSPNNDILDNFLSLPILENIYVEIKKGNNYQKIVGSSLKKQLERYFDAESFKSNYAYSAFKESNPGYLIDLLNNKISGENANKEKLIRFFGSICQTQSYNVPFEEYVGLVEGLGIDDISKEKLLSFSIRWREEKCVDLLKKNPPALKTIYDSILEGKSISKSVCDKFAVQCGLPGEPRNYEQERVDLINQKIEELYTRRAKEEFALLTKINDPYAVESQMINVYSLSEIASDKRNENRKRNRGEEKKFEIKQLRNYLSHGDPLISIEDHKYIAHQLVEVKNEKKVIDMLNEPSITPEKIEATMDSMPSYVGLTKIRELLCPLGQSGRITRSASGSCLTWEEIDKFNEVKSEYRDPDNIIIDSDKFISRISSEFEVNEEKFSKLIALASESEVIGDHTSKVNMLTDKHRYLGHLERVGEVSGMVMHGMMAKNMVGDILRGDYKDLAINLGFLGGSSALGKIAEKAAMRGADSILKGSELLGKSLRVASPFIARGATGFIAWDLFNQVKEYREGNKDALVPIIGDSIQIATDTVEIGVAVAEVFGVLEGVSAVTGPIGIAVGAVVFIGTDVYMAVRAVDKIDEQIHLTKWEKFTEGTRAFFGLQPSDDIEELIEGKDGNNQAVKNAKSFLKDNPHFQRYVFPSIEAYTVVDTSEHWYDDMFFVFSVLSLSISQLPKSTRTYTRKVLNNVVLLHEKRNDIKWNRIRPDNVEGIDLFCLPKGDWESVPQGGTYYCDGAIGVEYTNNRTGNNTLINLGDGEDIMRGFQGSSNIFVFGDGHKNMIGGNKDDNFIFEGKSANAINDSKVGGFIDGDGGIDTIDVGELAPHYEGSKGVGRYQVSADFREGIVKDTSKVEVNILNINEFLGRKGGVDLVVSACDTKHVDGRGGENKNYLDSVIIPKDDACSYDTKVTVNPYTKVTNNATRGKFLYIVKGEKGKEANIELGPSSQSTNTFVFNYTLKDVAAIDKSEKSITFSFVEDFYKRENKTDVSSSFKLTVSGADKNITMYYLIDNTKIVIGQNNVYAMQNTEKPIDSFVKDYSSIADKSHIYVVVHSNDEVLIAGHSHGDVLMNDPNARASHLVGGGGEDVFLISSGHEKLTLANLPISNVVIYDFDQGNKIDTLDLREIKEQLKRDIDREIHTEFSKIGSDLLINLYLDDASKKEVVKIKLKGALENNWYKRVHIVIDNIFVIKEILDVFELTPQPLIFDDNSKTIYVINPTDVAKGGKIRVKKEVGDYIFARDNDALIITNSSSPNADKNNLFTIILNDFYRGNNQDKMQSLKIEFNDQKIYLRKEIGRINSAGNYSELKKKVRIDSYKAVMYAIKKQKLLEAIEGNNIDEVKKLINNAVSINARNNDGQTLLHSAAKSGKLEVVKYLIEEKHADVNVGDNYANKPLHYAMCGGHLEIVKYLVEKKHAEVNFGTQPLHYAAYCGNLEVVKYLLEEKHANVNVNDNSGTTPLHYAFISANPEVVKYLIEKEDANVNEKFTVFQRTVLHYAAVGGNIELVKYLIEEKGANVNAQDYYNITPLHLAVSNGDLKIAKYLIGKGADIKVKDMFKKSVLHYAAIGYNQEELMEHMVGRGAYLNLRSKFPQTPLYSAVDGRLEVVKYLIEEKGIYDGELDIMQRVPLHYAASMGGMLEIFKYLKRNRVNCNVQDILEYTPFAADDGKLEVVKYLAWTRDTFDVKDIIQCTPLHFAAADGRLEIVKYIVGEGADFNVKNAIGATPLHFAAKFNRLEIVKYLVEEKGADVNARDYYKKAPLHIAAENNCLEVVKYLIEEKGADINARDFNGKVPLHLAAENNCLEVIQYRAKEKDVHSDGITLPHNAAEGGDLEMIKYLIEKGAKVDIKINDKTPLNILESKGYKHVVDSIVKKLTERLFDAVKYDDLGEVQDLIDQGVSVNVKDRDGQTLLHCAASNGRLKVVKYLVEKKGADVNAKDDSGMAPLQYAVTTDNLEMIKYLTETKGIDLNVIADNGPMSLKAASERGRSDIVEYLKRKLNEKREKPRRHKRSHHHSSRRLLTTDSSNQPEIATSNASETSSWMNDLVGPIVKLQESSAPSDAASSNRPVRHQRRNRRNDHSRHEYGIRMHRVRHRHHRLQKRNVKYQDSHYYIDQPEIATSSGTRPSSWINGLLDWIKEKGGGLVSSVADKFAAKESQDSKSRGIHACSVRLENMHGASVPNIPRSRKLHDVPKGNIPSISWYGWSSNREKVTSNVTDAPEMNTIVLNNALILGDLAVRLVNGTRHKQPIHENLLSLREKSMRFIDENMIMRIIQQGREKFGRLDTNMNV